MLPVKVRRVIVAQYKVDFRKQLDGLLGQAYLLEADPYRGDCVVFVKRDRRQVRALMGDALGLYLVTRRFEGGAVRIVERFCDRPVGVAISRGELSLLFEGARFSVHRRARACKAA